MLRREQGWSPNYYSRVCSRHFEGGRGPTSIHPVPTLFGYNSYKVSPVCRSNTNILKREQATAFAYWSCNPEKENVELQQQATIIDAEMSDLGEEVVVDCSHSDTNSLSGSSLNMIEPINQHDYLYTAMSDDDGEHSDERKLGKLNLTKLGDGWTTDQADANRRRIRVYVDSTTQTDICGNDIDKLLNEHSELKEKLTDRDNLRRELFIEKVIESDESVFRYTGFPSRQYLNSFFNILDKKEPQLKYWSDSTSAQEKNYQSQQRKKTGPKRKLQRYDEYLMTLVRLRLGLLSFLLGIFLGFPKPEFHRYL
ncbi:uncharacterized protein [Ptychodera flava]|uniref:uncharacterized protein n=1 Tax=Ptychodera flava TaxID=63121 RepID=UPI00396A3DB1